MSALLLAASFPPLHPLALPFVGLAPYALWVATLPADREGRRSAVRGSMLFGMLYFGIVFYWILIALLWFTWLAIPAYVGTIVALMAFSALMGWMLHRAVHEVRAPLWLALPVAWTAIEWLRAHLPGPIAFPWLGLGSALTGFPRLVGIAELVGSRGVTFWLALVNGLLATLYLRWRTGGRRGPVALAIVLVVALPAGWGVWRAGRLELREAGRVAVVQPNIREDLKMSGDEALDSTFASLERLMPRIAPGSVDLVVLPEVAFPTFVALPHARFAYEAQTRLQAWSREVGAPILFGSLGAEAIDDHYVPYNAAFLMRPQGLTDYRYDKRYLVPFVERVPWVPDRWIRSFRYLGGFGVGQGWPLARVDETAYAPLICYESTYPQGARTFRLAGADVLLNITNDAWYGREPWYARTTALWQHPAHMVMRAIENRVGVARAANTGISMFVDPVGRVYDATSLFRADVRVSTVYTTDVTTFYARYGDLLGNGSAAAALLLVLVAWRLGRRYPWSHSLDPTEPRH